MDERREYAFGRSRLAILFADILDSPAEVLVSSDDYRLTMGGGVSAAIGTAAGSALTIDAAKSTPRELGDVVVTTAGALSARYVFHVVTIGPPGRGASADLQSVVGEATRRCLTLVQDMGLTSIAFPALGTGAAGIPAATAATGMVDVIADFLNDCPAELSVELRLHGRRGVNERDFIAFYEMLAKQAPALERAAVAPQPAVRWEAHQQQPAPALALALEQQRVELERQLEDAVLVGDKPRLTQVLDELAKNVQQRTDAAASQRTSVGNAVSVFISYAHEDEGSREQLGRGLATLTEKGLIRAWHDRELLPGDRYNTEIADALNTADLALFLISPEFISSAYINGIELRRAYERERAGELKIVPIFVKKTYLVDGHPLRDFTSLPTDRKAITSWDNQDEAYYDVVTGIARLVKEISSKPASARAPSPAPRD